MQFKVINERLQKLSLVLKSQYYHTLQLTKVKLLTTLYQNKIENSKRTLLTNLESLPPLRWIVNVDCMRRLLSSMTSQRDSFLW